MFNLGREKVIHLAVFIWLAIVHRPVEAEMIKHKVAYPTTVGSMAVVWVAREAKLFEKHGITNIGYWVPVENPENKLVYVIAFPSREARDASFKARRKTFTPS